MTGFRVSCSTLFEYGNISAPTEYHITQANKTEQAFSDT